MANGRNAAKCNAITESLVANEEITLTIQKMFLNGSDVFPIKSSFLDSSAKLESKFKTWRIFQSFNPFF
jgi:hypothetical protein